MKTHWKRLENPNYIGAYSLDEGENRDVKITKVIRELVTGTGGKKEECTVAYLENEKPFILNRTNMKTITKIYNTPYIEEWVGKLITLYVAKIFAFGENVEALRVKEIKPSKDDKLISQLKRASLAVKAEKITSEDALELLKKTFELTEIIEKDFKDGKY